MCFKHPSPIFFALFFTLLWIMPLSLHSEPRKNSSATQLSWPELQQVLETRVFKSEEELFQLLHILQKQQSNSHLIIEGNTLQSLKKDLQTLFPLAACRSISMQNSIVTFNFDNPQDVALPNTWRQASIELPRQLVLKIYETEPKSPDLKEEEPQEEDQNHPEKTGGISSVHFKVIKGYVKIHFSFLLRIFGSSLRDADGDELVYQLDPQQKISRLILLEITPLQEKIQLLQEESVPEKSKFNKWIDVLHPDFPSKKDIGFAENRISYLGVDIELLPQNMIRIGEESPEENQATWEYVRTLIDQFSSYTDSNPFTPEIKYIKSYSYHFEEKQMGISMQFRNDN